MKITRRTIARMLAATAAIPAAAPAQQRPDGPAALAREQFDRNAKTMQAVKIPIATEPPFHFKA